MDHVYKNQLQTYALKQNLDLPVYAIEREGPPHAPRFRCTVTFCGQTFQGQEFFPTLKSAEHAAAKLALASLVPVNQEGIDVAYKNLLQEIAQKESSLLPVYATATSGPSHAPTFTSTVEFAGKVFRGEEAKTKKLAEMSAAKVAYMSVQHGNSNQTFSFSFPSERQEVANPNVESSLREVHPQPSRVMITPDVPLQWVEVYHDELPDVQNNAPASDDFAMNVALHVPANPTNVTHFALTANGVMVEIGDSSSLMPQNPTNDGSGTSSGAEESWKKKLIMGSSHLSIPPTRQHVVCRPWKFGMTLPQGEEMLFRDDMFIACRVVKP